MQGLGSFRLPDAFGSCDRSARPLVLKASSSIEPLCGVQGKLPLGIFRTHAGLGGKPNRMERA
jgi:hypothetical protein